jgi:TRAP-type mannitol/chloroaromatic compound transport system substrate-binding protein
MTDTPNSPRSGGLSNRAAFVAVATAFLVGVIASLSLRAPGGAPLEGGESARSVNHRWKLPVAFGTHLPALGDNAPYVAGRVAAMTAGSLVLEVFEPGEVVPPFSITEAVKEAKVEAGYTWLGYDQGRIPASVLFGAVPFGFEPWEYIAWWYHAGGRELGEELYAQYRIRPILCGVIGPETAGWFREPIRSLEDIRGLKIRFAGLGGMVMQALGASVTMLPGGEIFQALEKGAIDATEFSMPAIDARLGFDTIVKHNYFPGWHQPFTAFHLVVNLEAWERLDDPQQAAVETACAAGVTWNLAKGEALQGAVLEDFRARGIETLSLPMPVLRELERVSQEVLAVQTQRDPFFAKVLESQRAFSREYQNWKQLGFLPRDF